MKSKTMKVRRYLAAILTVLMIFQQATTSVIYASSEAAVPTVTEAPVAQTEETPENQVEETPEEKTPTEGENEGEKSAAPTEAPAENEAEPEVTVTPAAEPTATEAPAVEATATPVPEATPIPEVTETPEETPKTDFTYEDSRVAITAKAEEGANLPQDAELKADYIDPNSDVYKAAVEAFNVQLGNDDTVADYVLYDIYFLSASKEGRIEPEDGNVTVNVTFKTQQETENKGEILESQVVHLDDQNNAEVVSGNVDISSDGTVQSMTFTNNSFSPYGFRLAYAKQATPTVKSNEYYMTLEEAKQTTVKLGMAEDIRNAVQNSKIEIQCTYYDEAQNELNGINPDKFRDIQIGSMSGGRYLGNDFQNVDNRVAYVKITMLENELKNTFFTFSKNGPVKNGNDITFNIETRTFQPDEIWEANGLTYIAVGPEHQYNVSGPLGLINNFHAVGFTKVHNSTHTNGNILTKELTYGSNFGTNQVSNEISYIESFTSINGGMQCGADNNDILVIGKDIKVTCDGQHFYLNGQKLDKPKTVYQDTQGYKFLDVSSLKTEAVQLSTDMAGQPDQGVTKSEGKLIISEGYSGTAVCNITLEELKSHSQIEGLSNNSGTSLILNIKVSGNSVTIPQLSLNNVNNTGGEQGDFSAGKLIWNILNQDGTPYTGSVLQKEATTGTILVPNGTFTTIANWNGSMIANVVNINAESHRTDFTGTMGFGVEKLVEKDKSDAWQNNYKFQFELSAANGTPMPKGSKENSEENLAKVIEASYGNRTPSFGLITYSQSDIGKTYEYTLKELVGNVSGISYSKVVYKIKVEIQSNEGVGLSITRSYSSDGGNTWTAGLPKGDRFTFTNTFNNEKGSLTIIKNVTGENDDFAGTFYFTVTQGNKYSSYKYYDLNGNASSSKKVLALEYANKAGSITLNNLSVGTYEVTEVADAKGTAIKNATKFPYTVSKIKGSVEVVAGNAVEYTVTNSKGELKVSATVKKVWNDGNNRDGKRPENLKVDLKKGDTVIKEVTLNAGNNWTATVTDLKEKENGQTIDYTWSEKDLPEGYSLTSTNKEGSITTLTNSYTPGKVSATVKKIWDDGNNQDGKRPENLKVDLKKGETVVKEVTLNAGNNWTATVTDLEEKENGQTIDYTWSEKDLPEGYSLTSTDKEGSITTLTNSYTPGKVSATVRKIWNDGNNQDGKRPENLKVELKKGETVVKEVTLNAGNNWTATVTDLEEKENGQTIDYTWSEKDLPEGYSLTSTNKEGSITTLTNSYFIETIKIEGTKTWSDGGNQDGSRPSSITVNLLANGTKVASKEVTAKDNWKYSFTDLPKYENGIAINYTVTEDAVAGYSTTINGYDITNSYTPGQTSVTVTKAWVDNDNKGNKRPSEIKVQLYADGRESGSSVTLNEANKWTYTWTGLDEKNGGTTIAYTVKEIGTVDGYEASVSGDARTGYTITNTLKSGTLEIVKSITGDVSDSALTAEQKAAMTFTVTGPDGYSETVHYSDFVNGKYTFQNLPLGEYTVIETNADMEGYKLTTTYSVDGGKVTVTNKETATITITNDYTKTKDVSVKISKVDADTYEVLGGAHLQVIDPDGKVVAEWDSDKDAYTLTDLKPGVVYTLHETAAPKGYKVAEDTTFQLNEDGTIDTTNTTTAISDDTLLVKDEKKESKDVSVSVTKKLVTVDGTVIGAEDATYYVALYSDADCTQRVSDVLALNFKNASASTVTFTGLEKGQNYYVGECEADGTCYLANICADGTMYMVDFSDGNAVTVDNADGSTTVYFDNQFENIPDGYYKEAELNITKKLVGSDGKAKNSNEIFYAGIFADEGFTQLSTDVSQNIVPLDLAGGSEATALVNVALPESGSITLYVTEVDSNGKPVAGAASFKYDVTVDNAQVTLNDDNLSANVVITNTENSTKVTPTPGTPNTPNTPNTTGGFSGKSAVRTGDSTPIGGFIALFAAAAVIAGAAVFFKRRRKDEK